MGHRDYPVKVKRAMAHFFRHRPQNSGRPFQGTARWILLAVPALFLAVFFYYPLVTVLVGGFKTSDDSFSLQRVVALIQDPYIQRLIRFTFSQAFWSAVLSTLFGIPMAYVLARREFPGRNLLSALTIVPFVLPTITVALGFLLMFGLNGWFNQALDALFGFKVQILHTLWAILLAHAFYNAPVVARTTQAAWEQLDPKLIESARSLGATPWGMWRDITLPAILPALLSGAVLAFVFSFLSFPIVLALGGARYSTLEVEIYTQIRILWNQEMGAALAAIQAAISLMFAYVVLRTEGPSASFSGMQTHPQRHPLFKTSRAFWRDIPLWIFIAFAVLFFFGPMASVLVDSFRSPQGVPGWAGYERIFSTAHDAYVGNAPLQAIVNSLRFGFWSAALSLAMGLSFTYGIVRGLTKRRPVLETAALAPIVVSSVALGYGFLVAFRQPPLNALPPDLRVILVHAVLAFPFVVRMFRPVLQNTDYRLTEAARSLGARPLQAFIGVELPLMARGIFIAFAFGFGLSLSEMSATMMLARPGISMMPISVYRFIGARDFQAASAMAVLLIAVTTAVFLLIEWISKAIGRESRKHEQAQGVEE